MYMYIIFALIGYLLGSIPFGLVITRLAGLEDIRKIGSGNIGTTNVLRTGRKDLALLTLICDVSKAGVAAAIAMTMTTTNTELAGLIAGTFGVLGHNFPVWLKFKGGKGVASTIGMLLITSFPTGLAVVGTWLVMAVTFRYSSLSAIVAMALAPIYGYFFTDNLDYFAFYGALSVLCLYRHKPNIIRLLSGEETKIKFSSKKS